MKDYFYWVLGQKAWSHLTNPADLWDTSYLPHWGLRRPIPFKNTDLPRNRPALWIAWFTAFRLFNSSVWLLQRILYWFIKSLFRSYSSLYRVFMFFLGNNQSSYFHLWGQESHSWFVNMCSNTWLCWLPQSPACLPGTRQQTCLDMLVILIILLKRPEQSIFAVTLSTKTKWKHHFPQWKYH